jgi:hypothetical protein
MKWKGFWRKQSWSNLGTVQYLLEGLRKTTTNLIQDSWCPTLDSNRAPPECKSRVLTVDQPLQYFVIKPFTIFTLRTFISMCSIKYSLKNIWNEIVYLNRFRFYIMYILWSISEKIGSFIWCPYGVGFLFSWYIPKLNMLDKFYCILPISNFIKVKSTVSEIIHADR